MSNDIKISPKYGLNPTIPLCFFCGKPKNEIALMGKMGGRNDDVEAPMYSFINYEPCDHCREQWNKGIPCIECIDHPAPEKDNQTPIQKSFQNGFPLYLYPTGRWYVLKIDSAKKLFNIPNEQIGLGKPLFIDKDVMDMLTSRM